MSKSPARLYDSVQSNSGADGYIASVANVTVTIEGIPIASAHDLVNYNDGTVGVIQRGHACVLVNNNPIALVNELVKAVDGRIRSGAETIVIDEGAPFVFIGNYVSMGKNIKFIT